MKQHLIVTGDFVRTGGMDRANFALADFLTRRGDEVHLVAHRADPALTQRANVVFHRVPKLANSYFLSAPLLNREGKQWFKRLGRRDGITVVNGGNCTMPAVNWVHYVHAAYRSKTCGSLPRRLLQGWRHRIHRKTENRALHVSPLIIANSHRTRLDLINKLNIPDDKIRLVYYSVDTQSFYPATTEERQAIRAALGWSNNRKYVLFVGSPSDPRKGFDIVLEAWNMLPDSLGADVVLVVLGHHRPEVAAKINACRRSENIQLLGLRSDLATILRASDALVSPTRYEAYGLGVHEALCCAVPALVSRDAGVAERYPSELHDYLLSDLTQGGELRDRLTNWLNAPATSSQAWLELSQQLRAYSWDDASQQILDFAEHRC